MAGKFALLIGASTFDEGGPEALAAPEKDVEALRSVLWDERIAGFRTGDIEFALDERLERTRELVQWLFDDREKDDLLLLYYTGHGIKDPRDGTLYLALAGTKKKNPWPNSLDATVIQRQIKLSASDRKLVILDCCHSGAVGGPGGVMKGGETAAVEEETFSPRGYGSVTLASSSATQSSFEHQGVSIYTHALVEALRTGAADPTADVISAHALHEYLYEQVTKEVRKLGGLMEPVIYGAEKAPLIIARNPNPRRPLDKDILEDLQSDDPKRVELAAIRLGEIMAGADPLRAEQARTALTERLKTAEYLAYRAVKRIEELLRQKTPSPISRSKEPPVKLEPGTVFRDKLRDGSEGPEMVVLPAGEFMMGSAEDEEGRYEDEGPQHRVTISQPFAVGRYEVTFDEWDMCAAGGGCKNYRHSEKGWGRGQLPLSNVSWDDAQAYVAWLSQETGNAYRLLSEAEWEYAARAGTTTRYSFGDEISEKDANFGLNRGNPSEVGWYPANPWKLYDMHGNVWEWVEDCWNEDYKGAPTDGSAWINGDCSSRVLRGGSWHGIPRYLRSALRSWSKADNRNYEFGFRVARTLHKVATS